MHKIEIADEILIHDLEHGHIWISYKDPKDTALVEKLEVFAGRFRCIVVAPRSKNDSPIAVAAWARVPKLQFYDERQILAFIRAYYRKGPERDPNCKRPRILANRTTPSALAAPVRGKPSAWCRIRSRDPQQASDSQVRSRSC